MNRKQKIIVSITGIILVLLILVGLTYAYFLTRIQGNTNTKSISVTTADLAIVYGDGSPLILTAEKIIPSTEPIGEKTFTVTNAGNADVEYGVFLEDVINEFKYTSDLELTITCTSNIVGNTCNGYEGTMPTSNDMLLTNTIEPASTGVEAEVQTYTLTLTYKETGLDQSDDMNKRLEGKIQIYDLNNTVDLAGTVSDANTGDYVEVHSEDPKRSEIRNGQYKVVGLEPGPHTITVYSSGGTERYHKQLTISKGNTESISGTTVTVTNETRTVNTTVSNNDGLAITGTKKYYKINPGTFAYQIIENAKNATNEQITNLYAEYSPTPKTQPAAAVSGASESTLSTTEDDYGTSYYFRGNVANNYVNFGGLCWRIVRVEGDGSVKLLLEDSTYECYNASYDGNWSIGNTIAFGYDSNVRADFLGYNGGLADALKTYQTTLNTKIGTKYTSKGLADYLKVDEWCYDHNVTATSGSDEYYGAYTRINTNQQPSNVCTGTKLSKYGDNTTDMYVGTLTADEIAFAGGKSGAANNTYYLLNSYAQTNYLGWWALSPSSWSDWYSYDRAFFVDDFGGLSGGSVDGGIGGVARPAVSLKSSTEISSGVGTKANPYVIQ